MILRTFYNQVGIVNRVIYELPRHEEVHKDTKMRLIEKKGQWYVVADLKGKIGCALAEDKDGVVDIGEVDRPVA
jgi:hypothetical protein